MYNTQQIVHKHQPLQKGHQEGKTARISNVLQPSLELCIAGREWQPGCAPLCNESIKYTSLGNVCKKNFAHCIKNVCSCRKFPTKKSKQSVDYQNFPFICTKENLHLLFFTNSKQNLITYLLLYFFVNAKLITLKIYLQGFLYQAFRVIPRFIIY